MGVAEAATPALSGRGPDARPRSGLGWMSQPVGVKRWIIRSIDLGAALRWSALGRAVRTLLVLPSWWVPVLLGNAHARSSFIPGIFA